jgi:hypothetical protein
MEPREVPPVRRVACYHQPTALGCTNPSPLFVLDKAYARSLNALALEPQLLHEIREKHNTVILVSHRSTHKRMIEVIWEEKWYVAFERDVDERMEPLNKPENEDDPCRTNGAGSYK